MPAHKGVVPPKAWKPGQSGNPNGRPKKGTSVTEVIRDMMGQQLTDDPKDVRTLKDALAFKLYRMAMDGDLGAVKYIMDRMEGTPKVTMDLGVVDERRGFEIEFNGPTLIEDESPATPEVQ